MVTMGFSREEIHESLVNQKYDEVMATYLLLGRKPPEVSAIYSVHFLFWPLYVAEFNDVFINYFVTFSLNCD